MKKSTDPIRASHVNAGTAIPGSHLRQAEALRRQFKHPKLQVEIESGETTAYG